VRCINPNPITVHCINPSVIPLHYVNLNPITVHCIYPNPITVQCINRSPISVHCINPTPITVHCIYPNSNATVLTTTPTPCRDPVAVLQIQEDSDSKVIFTNTRQRTLSLIWPHLSYLPPMYGNTDLDSTPFAVHSSRYGNERRGINGCPYIVTLDYYFHHI
jgi:hypothetical protein